MSLPAEMLLTGTLAVAALMFVLWLLHFPLRNAAIVDAGWAGGLALLGSIYAVMGSGHHLRKVLMAAMVGIWGVRLAAYLLSTRVIGHPEEGRYVQLRQDWGTHIGVKFLAFFEFQAMVCVVLSVPFLVAALNPSPRLTGLEWAGFLLWLIAMAGESLADAQLNGFKSDPANWGRTCRAGLWRYSRHPNYFFEWLIWLAYATFALASPWGFVGLLSPALILYFLFKVTGIPATEAQALRSRGEEYREYQETTSAFIPWFPKERR
jgi:steroid 5-alpha reductase family enzyme